MRKTLAAFVMTVFAFVAMRGVAWAQDPLMGTWKLNLAKSKWDPEGLPKSYINRYEPSGTNGVKYTSDRVNSQGQAAHHEYTVNFDGKDYPYKGAPNRDTIALRRPDPHSVRAIYKKAGDVVEFIQWRLSKDGKTLTFVTSHFLPDDRPCTHVSIFDKQ